MTNSQTPRTRRRSVLRNEYAWALIALLLLLGLALSACTYMVVTWTPPSPM